MRSIGSAGLQFFGAIDIPVSIAAIVVLFVLGIDHVPAIVVGAAVGAAVAAPFAFAEALRN